MMENILAILSILLISTVAAENCSYTYNAASFTRTSILTIKGLPTNLVFNPKTKDLLFTLIDLETLHNDNVQTIMEQYVLRNGEPIKIDNVKGQAAAVDVDNDKVYIATDDGLTVLNETNQASFFSMKDEDIVQLFKPAHKEVLYATFFPENELFIIDLRKNEKVKVEYVPCAYFMAVDRNDNIFYECNSKYVKVLLKGFQEPIEFVGIVKGAGRAITIDNYDRAVLATNDGLYHLKHNNIIPYKLMDLDFIPAGIAFHGDDIYISTTGVIYKFSKEHCAKNYFVTEP